MRFLLFSALLFLASPAVQAQSLLDRIENARKALEASKESEPEAETADAQPAVLKAAPHGTLPDGCPTNTTKQCARATMLDQLVEEELTDATEAQFFEFSPGRAGVLRIEFERVLNDKDTEAILYDEHGQRLGNSHRFQRGTPGVVEAAVGSGPVTLLYHRHRVPTSSPSFAFRAELVLPTVDGKTGLGPTPEQSAMGCGPNTTSQCAWSVPAGALIADRFAPNAQQKHFAIADGEAGPMALDVRTVPLDATTTVVVYDQHRREIARQRFGGGTPGRLDLTAPGGPMYLMLAVDRPATHPQFSFALSQQ